MATAELLKKLDGLVGDEGQAVTYKWASRHFNISSNLAKQLLYAHVKQSGSSATYMLSGLTKGEERRHVVRLVSGGEAELASARSALAEVTGEHVYSVQKAAEASVEHLNALCTESAKQTDALFDAPPDTPNALRDNRHSAVSCTLVKRMDGPLRRVSVKKTLDASTSNAGAASGGGGASGLSSATASAAAARKSTAPGTTSAAAPVKSEVKKEAKGPGPFAGFKPVAKSAAGMTQPPSKQPVGGKPAAGTTGAKANMMAMFAKAPPKKKTTTEPAVNVARSAPPLSADVAIAQDEEMSEEEEEEEEIMEMPLRGRNGSGRGRRVVKLDDDDDDDDDDAPMEEEPEPALNPEPEPRPELVSKSKGKVTSGKKNEANTAKKRKSTEPTEEKRQQEEDEEVEEEDGAKAEAGAKFAPEPKKAAPSAKVISNPMAKFMNSGGGGGSTGGGAGKSRKKKVVTVMDEETGEEFTKTIWVDEDGNEVDDTAPALGEKTNTPAQGKKMSSAPTKPPALVTTVAAKTGNQAEAAVAAKSAPTKKANGQGIMNFFKKG